VRKSAALDSAGFKVAGLGAVDRGAEADGPFELVHAISATTTSAPTGRDAFKTGPS
jgi:hypothetical protein